MGQRAGSEQLLQEQASRIASRASYIAEFAFHDKFHPERAEDSGVVAGDDYGLLLHDPRAAPRRRASNAVEMPRRRTPAPRRTRELRVPAARMPDF